MDFVILPKTMSNVVEQKLAVMVKLEKLIQTIEMQTPFLLSKFEGTWVWTEKQESKECILVDSGPLRCNK